MRGLVTFAREHLGLELWPGQVDVLGRWEASQKRRAVLRLGRRSGKDVMGAVAAIKNAAIDDYADLLRPGEQRFIFAVATREQQAREFVRVVRELLDAAPDPDLRALVDDRASTSDEVVFRTGCTLRSLPCSSRAGRGYAVSLVVFNESAHYVSETDGFQAFREVWRSLVPATAQFHERGYVLTLSTPRWPSGWFHTLCEAGAAGTDPDLFHVHRPTWAMNPDISRESLAAEFVADPDGASAEYGAEFVSGLGAYLDAAAVYACQRPASPVLPPVPGPSYAASLDVAYHADRTALVVAHVDGPVIVDACLTWHRAGHEGMLAEVAAVLKRYGVRRVRIDQFAEVAVRETLARHGIEADYEPWTNERKSNAFGHLKAAINTGGIELPPDRGLLEELVGLQAKPTPSGMTRISAAAGRHDDRATALAGLMGWLCAPREEWTPQPLVVMTSVRRYGGAS